MRVATGDGDGGRLAPTSTEKFDWFRSVITSMSPKMSDMSDISLVFFVYDGDAGGLPKRVLDLLGSVSKLRSSSGTMPGGRETVLPAGLSVDLCN